MLGLPRTMSAQAYPPGLNTVELHDAADANFQLWGVLRTTLEAVYFSSGIATVSDEHCVPREKIADFHRKLDDEWMRTTTIDLSAAEHNTKTRLLLHYMRAHVQMMALSPFLHYIGLNVSRDVNVDGGETAVGCVNAAIDAIQAIQAIQSLRDGYIGNMGNTFCLQGLVCAATILLIVEFAAVDTGVIEQAKAHGRNAEVLLESFAAGNTVAQGCIEILQPFYAAADLVGAI